MRIESKVCEMMVGRYVYDAMGWRDAKKKKRCGRCGGAAAEGFV